MGQLKPVLSLTMHSARSETSVAEPHEMLTAVPRSGEMMQLGKLSRQVFTVRKQFGVVATHARALMIF